LEAGEHHERVEAADPNAREANWVSAGGGTSK
jgi:hypothetical protein